MKTKTVNVGQCDFDSYFKNLYENKSELGVSLEEIKYHENIDNLIFDVDSLNVNFSMAELDHALNKLKNNKAPGLDCILNEFLKNCTTAVKNVILKIFNVILDSGIFPQEWARGEIIPIFKKGDLNDPQNYRGITLLSCLGKLFTYILNSRLNSWAEDNSVLSDCQFGFRTEKSTVDCLFILNGLVQYFLNSSQTLYCSFIDLSRAFDSIGRNALWFKLQKSGIPCKIINLIKNMYNKIRLCVRRSFSQMSPEDFENKLNEEYNEHDTLEPNKENSNPDFTSFSGVFQGECLSPFLFSMFVNDISEYLADNNEVGIYINEICITALLFADDMIIFSKCRDGLQRGLDALKDYCDLWGLEVNKNKTKCLAFKKGGKISQLDRWTYDGMELETVSHFKYLGFVFGSSGKLPKSLNNILTQSYKALFNMKLIQHQYPEINIEIQLHLFKSLVLPVLNYGSEVWGFAEANELEKLHLGFLKNILSVKKSTPNAFVYKEIETLPLITKRLVQIFKFWLKVVSLPNNTMVKFIYDLLVSDMEGGKYIKNWATLVKEMLEKYGLGYIWNQQNLLHKNDRTLISMFKQRVNDIYLQNINAEITIVSNSRLYKHINILYTNNTYLSSINEKDIRITISKLRLGSHNLMIERGRWRNLELIDRECFNCGKLDDEFHAIVECSLFTTWRKNLLPDWLYVKPSMQKLMFFWIILKEMS